MKDVLKAEIWKFESTTQIYEVWTLIYANMCENKKDMTHKERKYIKALLT